MKALSILGIYPESTEPSMLAYTKDVLRQGLGWNLRPLTQLDITVWEFIAGFCANAISPKISYAGLYNIAYEKVRLTEMSTLNGALQEYERHFSGMRGHFPECCIFHDKSTKCTLTSFLSISPNTVPFSSLPNAWLRALPSTSCILFLAFNWLQWGSKICIIWWTSASKQHFLPRNPFFLYHRPVFRLTIFYPLK